ncbi:uncharacterized protein [Drosophila bipectinata]|uniref:uncharacterized protein n=1 Tax=Drosophila bipectinata TaxID=42026 RepID=UPI001C8A7EC0|nr:uncharacterized protein LOC108125144 isoform X1 [Drosophila bipectinata]XP_043067016.1 uncharacterized protein LOC108125144 isoform X1 [Drosophila bipectinata]
MSNTARATVPFRFTDERTLVFVILYGREPCLWNKKQYLQRARNAAYRRIQTGINSVTEPHEAHLTVQGVKMKIKNLRSAYHQELKKIRLNPEYQPKTPWFGPLHEFLGEFIDTNELSSPDTPPLKRLQIRLTRVKPIKIHPEVKLESEEVVCPETRSEPSTTFTVLPMPMAMSVDNPPTPPDSLSKILETNWVPPPVSVQITEPIPAGCSASEKGEVLGSTQGSVTGTGLGLGVGMRGEDEFTFFGLSVAAQLRNMPLANAMVMQSKIQYMLAVERRKISGHSTDVNIFK